MYHITLLHISEDPALIKICALKVSTLIQLFFTAVELANDSNGWTFDSSVSHWVKWVIVTDVVLATSVSLLCSNAQKCDIHIQSVP
jgi:hypothetical protein